VEIYSLRWQVELFFKELESSLRFHQYRFKRFAAVEGWVSLAMSTFLYLEWYRARQLAGAKLSAADKAWTRLIIRNIRLALLRVSGLSKHEACPTFAQSSSASARSR